MTAHSRRRKIAKRVKSKKGPVSNFVFESIRGIDVIPAHSPEEAMQIFTDTHGAIEVVLKTPKTNSEKPQENLKEN